MKTTKDKCLQCGAISTVRYPVGNIRCLECGHETTTSFSNRPRPSPAPTITVSRYRKDDGYATRNFAIYIDGSLLAVTLYRKGAETVRAKLMELLDGKAMSPVLPTYQDEECLRPPEQRADFVRDCGGSVSSALARENGFFAVAETSSQQPTESGATP